MTRLLPLVVGIAAATLLLFASYMGAYYGMLRGRMWMPAPHVPDLVEWRDEQPRYRWQPEICFPLFAPAHELDRKIRPAYWRDN
jgi:hypothetical protein